jgi:hypothetical protein
MSYTKITDYAAKDALVTGNSLKVVRGTELGAEFDAIVTADALNVKTSELNTTKGYIAGTAVTPSGSTVDFTGIPSTAKRINVMFYGMSLVGAADVYLRLGDAGGVEASGYTGFIGTLGGGYASYTTGFILHQSGQLGGATNWSGSVELLRINPSADIWLARGFSCYDGNSFYLTFIHGFKSTSATLDRIQFYTTGTFDGGTLNITYE